MDLAFEAAERNENASVAQTPGVGLALIPEYVVLSGQDDGGRQAGQVFHLQWSGFWLLTAGRIGKVVVPVGLHALGWQQ
ncbi:hypothetical protein D3C80_2115430 [compost metagenome]